MITEEKLIHLEEFINDNFKNGNSKAQLNNLKMLLTYLNKNEISSLETEEIKKLINNSKKLSDLISFIIKQKDNDLLDNEAIFLLVITYAKIKNVDLKLETEEIDDSKKETNAKKKSKKVDYDTWEMAPGITGYINSLPKELLTREEEVELAKRIKLGDEAARDEFINKNLRLVIKIAARYTPHYGDYFDDLIQEGNMGVMKAVEKFDPELGYKFSTYAIWWIRKQIIRFLYEKISDYRINYKFSVLVNKMKRVQLQYYTLNGKEIDDDTLMNILDISYERLKACKKVAQSFLSLETPLNGYKDKDLLIGDIITNDVDLDHYYNKNLYKEDIMKALNVNGLLTPIEREVLMLRYGINCVEPMSLGAIVNNFNCRTREGIRLIEKRALKKLHDYFYYPIMDDFINLRKTNSLDDEIDDNIEYQNEVSEELVDYSIQKEDDESNLVEEIDEDTRLELFYRELRRRN